MLGRLFKQSTLPNSGGSAPNQTLHTAQNTPASNSNTYDDSYTREILYASQSLSLKPQLFNPRRFRLLVCQDGGNLRAKQVLFDSAAELEVSSPGPSPAVTPSGSHKLEPLPSIGGKMAALSLLKKPSRPNLTGTSHAGLKNILLGKQLHNVNDLNDYMFGRGLPTNESSTATKIHMLEQVNLVYGAYLAVLVTKLFLIIDPTSSYADNHASGHDDPGWQPLPALPTKDAYYSFNGVSGKNPTTPNELGTSSRSSFHSRFSIGVVIPLKSADQSIEEVLSTNWDVISHYLVILQKVVTKKLISTLKYSTVNNVCPYINNRRIQFPSSILRSDPELMSQLNKLVKLVYFNTNVPRLMSSHSLISYSIDHPDSKFKSFLLNWALEVINWLEFKDGKNSINMHPGGSNHGNVWHNSSFLNPQHPGSKPNEPSPFSGTFLASLLAVLSPLKHLLTQSPMSADPNPSSNHKEVTRVVIMTGNSAVAKKLIFILNGIVPDHHLLTKLAQDDGVAESLFEGADDTDSLLDASDPSNSDVSNSDSPSHNITISDQSPTPFEGNACSVSPNTIRSPVKPIPIRQRSSPTSGSPSDDSMSISVNSTRGWEVPVKSSTSLSFSGANKSSYTAEPFVSSQQIPIHGRSSLSTSSSMAYLSSSLNSSLSSNASNYSFSKIGGSFMEKWKNSFVSPHHSLPYPGFDAPDVTSDMLNKRPSILSFRTPSPAYEIDEPSWEQSGQNSYSMSPAKLKISRTQSMLDLYNYTLKQSHKVEASEMPSMSLKRTSSSVFIPLHQDKGKDIVVSNAQRIKEKCALVMKSRVSFSGKNDLSLNVNRTEAPPSTSSTFLEQSTITSKSTDISIGVHEPFPLSRKSILPPNVAFVEEFRPEYVIQSCPVNPKLEVHVMNAMKSDLLFFQNNCGYEKVTSRTVFISLRAREIKLIEMNVGGHDKVPPSPNPNKVLAPSPGFVHSQSNSPGSMSSPVTSYFHGADAYSSRDRRGSAPSTNYSTVIKKIFSPRSISGDKNAIRMIGSQLEKLTEVVDKINNNGAATTAEDKDHFNRVLFSMVLQLVR